MKLGLFTSGYQRWPLERAFADAARFGYDYIELWGGRPHAFAPDLRAGGGDKIRRLSERYAMPVYVYTPEHNAYPYNYMRGSAAQRRDALDYLKGAVRAGQAVGAEYTLISAGHAGYGAEPARIRKRLVECLTELAEHAELVGHKLLLEPLTPFESNSLNTAGQLAEVLEAVGARPLFGVCDVTPPYVCGEPIVEYLDLLGERLRHIHLVDSDGVSDAHLVPGDGRIPLPELLAELSWRGYRGGATLELVSAYMNEPSLYARRAIRRVREMMPDEGAV